MITANRCAGRRNADAPTLRAPRRARPRWRRLLLLGAMVLSGGASGCVQMAAVWANLTGGDVVEPEFTLTKEPLLILIDDRDSLVTEPQAFRDLHQALSAIFLEFKVNRQLVPFENWQTLQRTAKDYNRLSVREIGEKLGASQVLYLVVDRFTLQAEPGAPLFKGEFAVRVKVLSTEAKRDVRLWPREEAGRRIVVTTNPTPADSDKSAGDVARELAEKIADSISRLFYEHRALDK